MYYTVKEIKPSALYTRAEASRILGISVSTIYRLKKRGMVTPRYIKGSSRPLYKGKDLIRLFKEAPSKLKFG